MWQQLHTPLVISLSPSSVKDGRRRPKEECRVGLMEWKKGTGSELDKRPNPPKTTRLGACPPFFTLFSRCPCFPVPQWRARKRGQAPSALRNTTASTIVDGASPHFRAPV